MKGETCILVAFMGEIKPFMDLLSDLREERTGKLARYRGSLGERRVHVIITQKGEEKKIGSLIEDSSCAISTGICGALVPHLKTGDIVFSTEVFSIEETGLESILNEANPKLLSLSVSAGSIYAGSINAGSRAYEKLKKTLRDEPFSVHVGATVTSCSALLDIESKKKVNMVTGALSVDMEDFSRLSMLKARGIPFISMRAVYDELHEEIPTQKGGINPSLKEKLTVATKSLASALKPAIAAAEFL